MDCELRKWFFEDQDIFLVSLKSTSKQETIWKKMKICEFWICIWVIHKLDLKQEYHWPCIAHLSDEDMLNSAVIEETKFKHSLGVGANNPLGPKILCQQEGLITMVICCMFKKNFFNF